MGSVSQKQNLLLGYVPKTSLETPSSRRSIDVDFHDVFGGPLRRSSVQDWRSSGNEEEEEGPVFSRNPWSGLNEKPVFGGGESSGSSRKKYHSDDFFDDIFRGDESSNSTPRKFSSPLSSRVSSPSRSLLNRSESFRASSLSLPPVLSLPTKLSKEMDSPAFPSQSRNPCKNKETAIIDFPSSAAASTSRFSIEVFQGKVGMKNDSQSSYRQSSLSKEVSLSSDGSAQVFNFENHESEVNYQEDLGGSRVTYSSTQFHFSIYKWPSIEVPVMRPLREENTSILNESGKTDKKVNGHDGSDLLGAELLSGNHSMPAEDESFQSSKENPLDELVISEKSDWTETSETYEDTFPAKREPKPRTNFQNILKKVQDNLLSQSVGKEIKTGSSASSVGIGSFGGLLEKRMPASKKEVLSPKEPLYCLLNEKRPGSSASRIDNHSGGDTEKRTPANESPKSVVALKFLLDDTTDDSSASGPDKGLFGAPDKTNRISKKEDLKPEEPLFCLLKDDFKRQGNGKNMDKSSEKKGTIKSIPTSTSEVRKDKKVKKQSGKRHITNIAEATRSSVQDPLAISKDKPDKVKGKVKDFVKIFNQEVPSEPLKNVKTRQQDDIVTDTGSGRTEDQPSLSTAKLDQKINRTTDTPSRVEQSSEKVAKPQREIKTVSQIYDFTSERNNNPASFSERIIDTVAVDVGNVEESYENFDCTVKELSQDLNNQLQSGQNSQEIQDSDAKIRKWSSGKEGNIRSLLSTLQYVLWPESGWKPVPLVDIIEGSSVRRAYQKALLCLHPDKLQQKGATPQQKYIAEKVFDILQEAWTQFNSLGSF